MSSKLFPCFLLMITGLLFPQADHIHWGSTGNPLNGLTITWHSAGTSDSIRWGYTVAYEKGKSAGTRRPDYAGNLFSYAFAGPTADTLIHYSIRSNAWEADRVFRTSRDTTGANFSFIAGGDSRTNMADWQAIAVRMRNERADFHLFAGDLVNSGTTTTDWDAWYASGASFLAGELVYYCRGNHEADGIIYANQFTLPPAIWNYAFEFGNALIICLNSENAADAAQLAWLRATLQTKRKTWNIVFFHRPFYTIGGHAGEMDAQFTTWWKLFDSVGVDIVLNGHTHQYMRSKPINRDVSTVSSVAEYGGGPGQGRLEVVAGSYGAPLYLCDTAWFSQVCVPAVHYTRWDVSGNRVHMSAIDVNGNLIDSLTLIKPPSIAEAPGLSGKEITVRARPNPAGLSVPIEFECGSGRPWTVAVYELSGRKVFEETGRPGNNVKWQPRALGLGVYLSIFTVDGKTFPCRVAIIR
jgi:predicted phosphodiesterase